MKKYVGLKLGVILSAFFVGFVFILLSYLVQTNLYFFEKLIINDFFGMIVYVFLHFLAIVLMPITVFPIISLATGLWGWKVTFFLTLVGWEIGAIVAFILARKFGVVFLEKFISLEEIHKLENKSLKFGGGFWQVLFLRMVIPVDGLSYAIGLFSKIKIVPYSLATLFGVMPFLFLFSYLGEVSFVYQIILGLAVMIIFVGWLIFREVFSK